MSVLSLRISIVVHRKLVGRMVASIEHKERNYESPQYVLPSDFNEEHRCVPHKAFVNQLLNSKL